MTVRSSLTCLECGYCGKTYPADRLWNLCLECQKPLLARYDLAQAAETFQRDALARRRADLWRYREVLPVRDDAFALRLGEGWTPLVRAERLGRRLGAPLTFIKDESLNPTGSFKARGLAVAVSRAVELGARELALPSAGNAGGALSAYAAAAGVAAHVFLPRDVPHSFRAECEILGASVTLVDGLITDCAARVREGVRTRGWFDLSTLREPYRVEGKKTMGYELAEQCHWDLPDVVLYPTGGGTGLIGMWKAFAELEALGLIGPRRPRMVVVQSSGCAPIVRAFERGDEFAEPWQDAATIADGLRVPAAVGDFLILQAVRESQGTAVSVDDEDILRCAAQASRETGILFAPEGAACVAAAERLVRAGWIQARDRVVVFNTGTGLKYLDSLSPPPDRGG